MRGITPKSDSYYPAYPIHARWTTWVVSSFVGSIRAYSNSL